MNITLVSSSFLFPGNLAWNKINMKKNFCEIGDYKILQDKKKDFVVLVLFLKDFYNNNFNEYLKILRLLDNRSKDKEMGTLVMISSFKSENIIKINRVSTMDKHITIEQKWENTQHSKKNKKWYKVNEL